MVFPDPVNGRKLRHTWTEQQRIVLALLHRLYEIKPEQRLRIWNDIFKSNIQSEGFANGYPMAAMRQQLSELKSGGTGAKPWNDVYQRTLSEARQSFGRERELIESSAQVLRIALQLRLEAPTCLLVAKLPDKTEVSVARARRHEWSSSSEEENDPTSPPQQHERSLGIALVRSLAYELDSANPPNPQHDVTPVAQISRSLDIENIASTGRPNQRPMLRLQDLSTPKSPRRFPSLLFRAFLAGHGFTARKFLANPTTRVPPPPPFTSGTFLEMVEPHLREYLPENATYLSPFLSLAENPANALKRISKSQLPLWFAMFYTPEIMEDAKQRYGPSCMPYPYLVPSVCMTHKLNDLPGRYSGSGEWLSWATIECPPIAVFDTDQALQLLNLMSTMKIINSTSGSLLGHHLISVEDKFKELVAYKFLRAFQVRGFRICPQGEDYDNFIEAVYDVTRGDRAQSILSEYSELPCSSPRPAVVTPASGRSQDKGKGRAQEQNASITWRALGDTGTGQQISVAVPGNKPSISPAGGLEPLLKEEDEEDFQEMINTQLESTGNEYGLSVDRASTTASEPTTPTSTFFRGLQDQALLPTPPPLPPIWYNSSPPEAYANPTSNTVIMDLCNEMSEDQDRKDEFYELGRVDLTMEDDNGHDEDDCVIIAAGTRARGPHSALSIRSRSLSTALSTPCPSRNATRRGQKNRVLRN